MQQNDDFYPNQVTASSYNELDDMLWQLRRAHRGYGARGLRVDYAGEPMTFEAPTIRPCAPLLRELMARHSRDYHGTPRYVHLLFIGDDAQRSGLFRNRHETAAAHRLANRVGRMAHYLAEIEPGWKDVRPIHYADNSEEMEQVNKHGQTRQVRLSAPGGDLCF